MTTPFTNQEMRACAERELGKRRHVYPRLVAEGKMTQKKADHEVAVMAAILAHFAILEKQEEQLPL